MNPATNRKEGRKILRIFDRGFTLYLNDETKAEASLIFRQRMTTLQITSGIELLRERLYDPGASREETLSRIDILNQSLIAS